MPNELIASKLMLPPGQWIYIYGMFLCIALIYCLAVEAARIERYETLMQLRAARKACRD